MRKREACRKQLAVAGGQFQGLFAQFKPRCALFILAHTEVMKTETFLSP